MSPSRSRCLCALFEFQPCTESWNASDTLRKIVEVTRDGEGEAQLRKYKIEKLDDPSSTWWTMYHITLPKAFQDLAVDQKVSLELGRDDVWAPPGQQPTGAEVAVIISLIHD